MSSAKLRSLNDVAKLAAEAKSNNQKIIHCHGVFDLLHLGHLRYLAAAKAMGDILVVTVTADQFVNKGPGRPVFEAKQRAEMLAALDLVDAVAVSDYPTAIEAIEMIRPDYYVKGSDYETEASDPTGNIVREKLALTTAGGRFATTYEETFSSSRLINDHFSPHDYAVNEWLETFKANTTEQEVLKWIDSFRSLRVLVLGEAIIDEYMMCEALGKSSKDPVLAFRELHLEQQLGGSLAIARHCASLGAKVTVGCELGDEADVQGLLTRDLTNFEDVQIRTSKVTLTMRKRRFVDESSMQKVFETYSMQSLEHESYNSLALIQSIDSQLFDIVLVCDYGHGFFSSQAIDYLCDTKSTLAVNTQSNAGNRGFNTIGKYPRADYVCLNGGELALELRRRHMQAEAVVPALQLQLSAQSVIVTEGAAGVLIQSADGTTTRVPAFAPFVRDRVGAGDALFAATSLAQASGAPPRVTGFLGNLAGAAAVSQLGNRDPISAVNLSRHAVSLFT